MAMIPTVSLSFASSDKHATYVDGAVKEEVPRHLHDPAKLGQALFLATRRTHMCESP